MIVLCGLMLCHASLLVMDAMACLFEMVGEREEHMNEG